MEGQAKSTGTVKWQVALRRLGSGGQHGLGGTLAKGAEQGVGQDSTAGQCNYGLQGLVALLY